MPIISALNRCPYLLYCCNTGEENRHYGKTGMNNESSRSHTIFRMVSLPFLTAPDGLFSTASFLFCSKLLITKISMCWHLKVIESREKNTNDVKGDGAVRVSLLVSETSVLLVIRDVNGCFSSLHTQNLVDLAGSERAVHTKAEGITLKEGSHINKSLLNLGTVIAKLAEGQGYFLLTHCFKLIPWQHSHNLICLFSFSGHIPYRNSKLTRILESALGGITAIQIASFSEFSLISYIHTGNSRTAIICTITPSAMFRDESISTLKFANRAKQIKNKPIVNEVLIDPHTYPYYGEIQSARLFQVLIMSYYCRF